jgi:hypothetical protein
MVSAYPCVSAHITFEPGGGFSFPPLNERSATTGTNAFAHSDFLPTWWPRLCDGLILRSRKSPDVLRIHIFVADDWDKPDLVDSDVPF